MIYRKYLNNLIKRISFKSKKISLDHIFKIHKGLNNPSHDFISVHVAGTNGKGSVCKKIENAFLLNNYKVATLTSPHISTFKERIQINNQMITNEDIIEGLEKICFEEKKHKIKISFFDALALLAFLTFSKHKVDIAIIETGLGGRLDATNIINPILSIITSISYDHMSILGNSLEEIAIEKAGIIKKNIPVVLGPTSYKKVVLEIAHLKKAKILKVNKNLKNFYDDENKQIAKTALLELSNHFNLKTNKIKQALTANPPCRFEVHKKNESIIILDVAHNLIAFKKLFYEIKTTYPGEKFDLIITFSKNKDFQNIFKYLIQISLINKIYILDIKHSKLESAPKLHLIFQNLEYNNCKILKLNKKEILNLIKNNLLITGSFFHMHKIKTYLSIKL